MTAMDEHEQRAREVLDGGIVASSDQDAASVMAALLRSTAAAAVAAERERCALECLAFEQVQLDSARKIAVDIEDDAEARSLVLARVRYAEAARAICQRIRSAPVASPAQAERVSEEEPVLDATDAAHPAWWCGYDYNGREAKQIQVAVAEAVAALQHRIAARLRARADEEERDGRDVQRFTVTERAACHRASLALRSEADALEGT